MKKRLMEYTESEFLQDKMTWEESEDLAAVINEIPDNMDEQTLLEKVKGLDDNNKKLMPIVMKILGDWGVKNG